MYSIIKSQFNKEQWIPQFDCDNKTELIGVSLLDCNDNRVNISS